MSVPRVPSLPSASSGALLLAWAGLGAACFSLAALRLARGFAPALEQEMGASVDPTRIVQGIIGGIGFLGAGAIIQDRRSVEGLTTAAGIWLVGAVGVACGAGDYALAALVVAVALVVQVVVGKVERALVRPLRDREGDAE